MPDTITNLDTYVNGIKVLSSDNETLTLVNSVVIKKKNCKYISSDLHAGATYYHYQED